MELGTLSLPRRLDLKATDTVFLQRTPTATANYGVLNIGDGPFDGISTGKFSGNVNGTLYAGNAASGFTGILLDLQVAGTSVLSVSPTNVLIPVASTLNVGLIRSLGSLAGGVTFRPNIISQIALTVQGLASQSADLQQWTNSSATALALVDASGALRVTTIKQIAGTNGPTITLSDGAPSATILSNNSTYPLLILKGAAGQTADLHQWQNNGATVLAKVDASGNIIQSPGLFASIQMAAPTSPAVGAFTSGGSLSLSTTYYWAVTALDPFGGETISPAQITATTAGSGTLQTAPLSWTASPGAMGYNVYRSTTSNNFVNATRYTVVNATTFNDTGAAGTTATLPGATTAYTSKISPASGTPNFLANTTTASANYGLLSIGSGPFDGVSTGKFAGSASGTIVGVNTVSGYVGDLIKLQVAGADRFTVTAGGNVVIPNGAQLQTNTIAIVSSRLVFNIASGLTNTDGTFLLQSTGSTVGMTASSGTQSWLNVASNANQTGTAGYTALLVNSTETAIGSGARLLADLQLAGVSKFSVTVGGDVTIGNILNLPRVTATGAQLPFIRPGNTTITTGVYQFSMDNYASPTAGLSNSAGIQSFVSISSATNQSGTAGYTALLVNSTEIATGSGTKLLADFQLGGVSKCSVNNAGNMSITGTLTTATGVTISGGTLLTSTIQQVGQQISFRATANQSITSGMFQFIADSFASPTAGMSASSGTQSWVNIAAVANQSGTAGYTALLVNATELATGSGTKLLQDWQVAGSSKASVDKAGDLTLAGGVTTAYASKSSNYTVTTSDSVIVAAAASLVITLPSAAAVSAGRVYTVKNNNQTTTTVKTSTAGQTIDGTDYSSSGYALNTAFGVLRLVGDGSSSWFTI